MSVKIIEIENKKITEMKTLFSEKIKEAEKPLAMLIR